MSRLAPEAQVGFPPDNDDNIEDETHHDTDPLNGSSTGLLSGLYAIHYMLDRQGMSPSGTIDPAKVSLLFNTTGTGTEKGRTEEGSSNNQQAAIRYHLYHPKTPRPLHFSRNRALRHWTIHRAWQRHLLLQRKTRELELERQYNAMAAACEALRLVDNDGLTDQEAEQYGANHQRSVKDVGRLYRQAMMKDNVWDGVPIEYARMQTETPGRDGWNHAWTR